MIDIEEMNGFHITKLNLALCVLRKRLGKCHVLTTLEGTWKMFLIFWNTCPHNIQRWCSVLCSAHGLISMATLGPGNQTELEDGWGKSSDEAEKAHAPEGKIIVCWKEMK